jgi:hypothetical protein
MAAENGPSVPLIQSLAATLPPGRKIRMMSANSASLFSICHRVLAEDQVEGAGREGQGGVTVRNVTLRRPGLRRAFLRPLDQAGIDIDADDARGSICLGQERRDPAGAAAEIEHRLAGQRHALDDGADLVRPARRHVALAPDQLQQRHQGVVILLRPLRCHDGPSPGGLSARNPDPATTLDTLTY